MTSSEVISKPLPLDVPFKVVFPVPLPIIVIDTSTSIFSLYVQAQMCRTSPEDALSTASCILYQVELVSTFFTRPWTQNAGTVSVSVCEELMSKDFDLERTP